MNITCNFFRNSFSPECEHEATVMQILNGIKNGRWKDKVDAIRDATSKEVRSNLKKSLPAVTFSGTFNKRRLEKNIKRYSHLMVIDIDGIGVNELKKIKRQLVEDPYIICFFESPSRGLKALVEVSSPLKYHKSVAFPFVQDYFKQCHQITIDKSGKDVSRLCYVSYDPDLYKAKLYDVFDIPEEYMSDEDRRRANHFESMRSQGIMEESSDTRHIFDTCKKWVGNGPVGSYHKGNRNNFIHALACCLNRAGMDEHTSEMMIIGTYQSLKHEEIKATVSSAYRHYKHEFGTRPILRRKTNQSNIF